MFNEHILYEIYELKNIVFLESYSIIVNIMQCNGNGIIAMQSILWRNLLIDHATQYKCVPYFTRGSESWWYYPPG